MDFDEKRDRRFTKCHKRGEKRKEATDIVQIAPPTVFNCNFNLYLRSIYDRKTQACAFGLQILLKAN